MLKKISVIAVSAMLACSSLCSASTLDVPAIESTSSGSLSNIDTGSLSNMSIDIGKNSSGSMDMSLDASALNSAGVSLGSSSPGTGASTGTDMSGANQSPSAFSNPVSLDDLNLEMPTLEGLDTSLDVGQYLPEQPELKMPEMESLRTSLSDSMKENAAATLQNSFGDKFKDLNQDIFGISNMPEVSFESLNVQYASMIQEFEKNGYGKNFELGTLPQGKSTQETIDSLESQLTKMELSGDTEYQTLKDSFKKEGYGEDYSLSMPSTGHSITSKDAVDVFNKKYDSLPSGVDKLSSNFNASIKALQYANEAKSQSFADFYSSDAYSSFNTLSGLAGASASAKKAATARMSMSNKTKK